MNKAFCKEKRFSAVPNKTGTVVLGSWVAANLAVSPVLVGNAEGAEKYFHQMNASWNAVNLTIAAADYVQSNKRMGKSLGLSETLREQNKMERILLFNTGLGLAYVTTGMYLIERSKNTPSNRNRLKGFGQSFVLQGGFLFVFDMVLFTAHRRHGEALLKFADKLSISLSGV